ncbi:MAG: sigma-54 dependent transcriptional regulator [Phycisphaerae bacterium]
MEKETASFQGAADAVASGRSLKKFVGHSVAFRSIIETIDIVAKRQSSVIITGQTGTGKEMVARQIHHRSLRADKVFVPVDCSSLSGQIFESQLFGHSKGSFTGAVRDTLGFFRAANTGTIFLDEIGELELDLQAKLLRVLQESAVTPVGEVKAYPIDVRVICATNRDILQMVRDGTFRADLYFRLNIIKIEVPLLKERKEDIAILADYFLDKQANLYDEPPKTLAPHTLKILESYDWPGNVRQLANAMEHAYVTSKANIIAPLSLPAEILTGDTIMSANEEVFMSFDDIKRKMVIQAMQKTNGRKMAAAELLKIDHRNLARLVEKFDLQPTWR